MVRAGRLIENMLNTAFIERGMQFLQPGFHPVRLFRSYSDPE